MLKKFNLIEMFLSEFREEKIDLAIRELKREEERSENPSF